jgi:hypothetical protein
MGKFAASGELIPGYGEIGIQTHLPQALFLRNYPHSMNYSRDITEQRQQDINPKIHTKTYLQKYTQRR